MFLWLVLCVCACVCVCLVCYKLREVFVSIWRNPALKAVVITFPVSTRLAFSLFFSGRNMMFHFAFNGEKHFFSSLKKRPALQKPHSTNDRGRSRDISSSSHSNVGWDFIRSRLTRCAAGLNVRSGVSVFVAMWSWLISRLWEFFCNPGLLHMLIIFIPWLTYTRLAF